jgi:2'-5' RNA ligase
LEKNPLILTLAIEEEAFHFFNELRKKYFPASRNFIDAHLTLFHALTNNEATISTIIESVKGVNAFSIAFTEPISIGKGVAYKVESKELLQLHKTLQSKWLEELSPQDKQKLWPHITVQNKVQPHEAKELLLELKNNFTPFKAAAEGLQLWEYLNGPWKFIERFDFAKL